ncbi:MAG: hypothetical protein ACRDQ1_17835 [Sciscionella sp.]
MPIVRPPKHIEEQLNRRSAELAAEYAEEERAAAEEEIRERDERDRKSSVYSVRLPPTVYEAVRELAEQRHLTPSALVRQWISERVDDPGGDDLTAAVADLRRNVERVAKLSRPA